MSLWAEGVLKSLVQLSLSVEVVGSWPGHNVYSFSLMYTFLKCSRESPKEKALDLGDLPPKAESRVYRVGGGEAIIAGFIKLSKRRPYPSPVTLLDLVLGRS